jgi:hypothetical protein
MSDIVGAAFLPQLRGPEIPIVVSEQLPMEPTDAANARRIVRHGLADVLGWCGLDVGPAPGEPTHALLSADLARPGGKVLFCSREYATLIRGTLPRVSLG